MNEEFEDENESFSEKLKITFFQLFGMVTGITIMVCLNLYEDEFNFYLHRICLNRFLYIKYLFYILMKKNFFFLLIELKF